MHGSQRGAQPDGQPHGFAAVAARKEELLIPKNDLDRIWVLRRVLQPLNVVESMEFLSGKLVNFKTNTEFLDMMDKM